MPGHIELKRTHFDGPDLLYKKPLQTRAIASNCHMRRANGPRVLQLCDRHLLEKLLFERARAGQQLHLPYSFSVHSPYYPSIARTDTQANTRTAHTLQT